ncbi:hypothetical protein [Streptomyces sp. NBC_01012]|uniref:hypothetical protein n=1 Tax=Streptomyces sp. NBC_01012 TaxID=2903717 RepID=UPI0038668EE7|nr:hypothetical protein OG623_34825 [Streptomyces sp. NBC_01012]
MGIVVGVSISREQSRKKRAKVGESRHRLNQAEDRLAEALRHQHLGTADAVYATSAAAGQVAAEVAKEDIAQAERDLISRNERESREARQPKSDEPLGSGSLALPELWQTTHARLGLYHDIATGQAETSFRNAQRSMWAGFALLIVFAGLAVRTSSTAGAIVAGGLGVVAAALAGFVSKTFIRSQEAAASHLRGYFDQPLELSRYLAAERLVADADLSQEQRGEILSTLVHAMAAAPDRRESTPSTATASVPAQQGP